MDPTLAFMTSANDCIVCDAGFACSVGSAEQTACLPGTFGARAGMASCESCAIGKFTPDAGRTACLDCRRGFLCVEGSSAPQPCPAGTYADPTVLATIGYLSNFTSHCVSCPAGTSCSVGSRQPTPCLPGSISASANQASCKLCPTGDYQDRHGETACTRRT